MAAKLAIEEVTHRHLSDIVIEGVSQVITNAILNPITYLDWTISNILRHPSATQVLPELECTENSSKSIDGRIN